MSAIGELLLKSVLSHQRLGETHDPRRSGICRPKVLGEKCGSDVIAIFPVTSPVCGSKLNED